MSTEKIIIVVPIMSIIFLVNNYFLVNFRLYSILIPIKNEFKQKLCNVI